MQHSSFCILLLTCSYVPSAPSATLRNGSPHDFGECRGAWAVPAERGENGSRCGGVRYMAQELLADDQRALDKGDMFALGMTVYQLATGFALPKPGDGAPHSLVASSMVCFSAGFDRAVLTRSTIR